MDDLFLTTGVWIYDPPFFFGPTVSGKTAKPKLVLICVEMLPRINAVFYSRAKSGHVPNVANSIGNVL